MGRGIEKQLQVCENLNYIIQRFKGYVLHTKNNFSTIYVVQNQFVGLLIFKTQMFFRHIFVHFFSFLLFILMAHKSRRLDIYTRF